MMTLKKKSGAAVMLLLSLFLLSAFLLLSLRDESFDPVALLFGGVLTVYFILQYNLLCRAYRNFDRYVMLAAQALMGIGFVVLYRLDTDMAVKQFLFLLIGSIAMLIMIRAIRKTGDFGKINWVFMALTVGLLLSAPVLGRTVGGARNWIRIGPVSIQPSEFAKILFIVVSAYFLSTRDNLKSFIPYVAFTGVCVMIQVVAKDLGSALLIGGTFLIMFYAATGRTLLTLLGIGVLGGGAVASYHLFSHVRTRVQVWQDPWAFYDTSGYQIVQGLIALASGGLFGTGLGLGMPSVVPANKTDYIFTVIGEEFGIIVGVLVIAFYMIFIVRGMLIAMDTDNTFDALVVFGCTTMLALQSFIIIGGVIKLIPLTGITLPFISAGGSSMISSLIMVGAIEGIAIKNGDRDENRVREIGGEIG